MTGRERRTTEESSASKRINRTQERIRRLHERNLIAAKKLLAEQAKALYETGAFPKREALVGENSVRKNSTLIEVNTYDAKSGAKRIHYVDETGDVFQAPLRDGLPELKFKYYPIDEPISQQLDIVAVAMSNIYGAFKSAAIDRPDLRVAQA